MIRQPWSVRRIVAVLVAAAHRHGDQSDARSPIGKPLVADVPVIAPAVSADALEAVTPVAETVPGCSESTLVHGEPDVVTTGTADVAPHDAQPSEPQQSRRPAIQAHRLSEEIRREMQRSVQTSRPGVLAAVTVAEWDELRRRLGSQGEDALAECFESWAATDADPLEQHTVRDGGGFLVLMPETELAAGLDRLRLLARRMADAVIEVGVERLLITPVIGYAAFAGAESADSLREHTAVAVDDAQQRLDLLPVSYSPELAAAVPAPPDTHDRLLVLLDRLRAPLQVAFTGALLLFLPFIVYVVVWEFGFDLTHSVYIAVSVVLFTTAMIMWVECLGAVRQSPPPPVTAYPMASAIVAAYLPNEAATIVDTITAMLAQDYPSELQIILAYNTPIRLPVELVLAEIADRDPRLLLLQVPASTSKAQNVNAAMRHVRGEFVGVFDADHHPAPGSFARAWQWLAGGADIVQGHCVVRNGGSSWVARLVAVEFETIYAVNHPGRARLHAFGIFGGSNGYWRTPALRRIRMHGSMLTEDIDSSMRSLLDGLTIVSDPGLLSSELAPTSIRALWHQRMRWAQGWTQTAVRHLGPALVSDRLSVRQKVGAIFLLGWTQMVPWVTVQVLPILAFVIWRGDGIGSLDFLIPLFAVLTIFTLSVGVAQTVFAYVLSDSRIKAHRAWFVLYGLHSLLWFGEFKNVICRVAQLKELIGERQWRVTPRRIDAVNSGPAVDAVDSVRPIGSEGLPVAKAADTAFASSDRGTR